VSRQVQFRSWSVRVAHAATEQQ